mmetsp:Transcript_85872/g.277293  ORF Transcript_85872/g.277293 Transcript_85872/m.277293 type:complete len:177 (-) Transcript_85872:8-538(-)
MPSASAPMPSPGASGPEAAIECQLCRNYRQLGHLDPDNLRWYCEDCWKGFSGDSRTCFLCRQFVSKGAVDLSDKRWYCDDCWGRYGTDPKAGAAAAAAAASRGGAAKSHHYSARRGGQLQGARGTCTTEEHQEDSIVDLIREALPTTSAHGASDPARVPAGVSKSKPRADAARTRT